LAKRPNGTDANPYPVFIVSVEGGGIYAAAAASLLLAKLQDSNPGFAQHVFAVSGVSGGAIGATIFQALIRSASEFADTQSADPMQAEALPLSDPMPAKQCKTAGPSDPATIGQRLEPMVESIMLTDHFSPVVGSIFPEFLGTSRRGRADTLAGSFHDSVASRSRRAAHELDRCFHHHWSASSRAPALVLNATWAEKGERVAFSPFPLGSHDNFLRAFSDIAPGHRNIDLMEAAVVSARFPAILPPHSLKVESPAQKVESPAQKVESPAQKVEARESPPQRWNFVDGGYSDASGATTALAIYRALANNKSRKFRIILILLTSANVQPQTATDPGFVSGTAFRDTLAPIDAVLQVRAKLASQAVARVCDYFGAHCKRNPLDPEAAVKIVRIEDESYRLPLGWKLSRTTYEVVRWMLGDANRCEQTLDKRIVRSNSCVLQFVSQLLQDWERNRPSRP
jgi:hypothetical protein